MKGYPPIQGVKLNSETIKRLRDYFSGWSIFTAGKTKISITPSGGVHYTGSTIITNAVSFEIRRGNAYIMITLLEYPKGVIVHMHIFYPDINKYSSNIWDKIISKVYEEVKNVLLNNE